MKLYEQSSEIAWRIGAAKDMLEMIGESSTTGELSKTLHKRALELLNEAYLMNNEMRKGL